MNRAPKIAPDTEARPSITIPTRKVIERNTLNEPGATKATARPPMAPAIPV
jgi:hypothetical protein